MHGGLDKDLKTIDGFFLVAQLTAHILGFDDQDTVFADAVIADSQQSLFDFRGQ
jgi:hypothetical protein